MIDYLKGKIEEISPTELVLENNGIGYSVLISLQTYESLKEKSEAKVYIHYQVREDDREFYGFATKDERELFKLLIGVNSVGVATARMMLSSMSSEEVRSAILSEDLAKIKSVKGVGLKTAQKIIIELKDKIVKGEGSSVETLPGMGRNEDVEEATRALIMLGFTKQAVSKAIQKVLKENGASSVEELIKAALKLV